LQQTHDLIWYRKRHGYIGLTPPPRDLVPKRCHCPLWVNGTATSAVDPAADAAMTALLDHLAEELAREYVHLMEKAARDERIDGDASR